MAALEWVAIQLTPRGEDEDPDVLIASLKRSIKTAEIFVPASISKVGETRVIHRLVEGYVFIRRTDSDNVYFRLENTKYVDFIITTMGSQNGRSVRRIAAVPDLDVEKMRRQIHVETEQGINVGDEVQVTSGVYKGINASVIEEIKENDSVQVHIKLRSKEAIVTLPRSYLKFVARDKEATAVPSFSPFATKIARVRDWVQRSAPVFQWKPRPFSPIVDRMVDLKKVSGWTDRMNRLFRLFHTYTKGLPIEGLQTALAKLKLLEAWVDRGTSLFPLAKAATSNPEYGPVEKKLVELQWFQDAVSRLEELSNDVDQVESSLYAARSPDMIQNVIVDGHNLAYRVFHAFNAPNSKPMTDEKGRPTSIIYGVLKGIASLKKKFPEAQLYVCWDGSPSRRKAMCPEYKAQRPARSLDGDVGFSQIEYLRQVLPYLGVFQTFNADEETDDIIGCLVKGPLLGQNNVIVSTDHDFLQLVTRTDILLTPKVGNRPETLYDPDRVVADYGVQPEKIVQLRALMGSADTSDNLKGVPRVPTKVLVGLINAHGSVDGVYSSGLPGVTPNQYEKFRAAEKQVKLNVKLMTLMCDLSYTLFEGTPDPEEATALLAEVDVQAEPILKAFFREMRGFEKHS